MRYMLMRAKPLATLRAMTTGASILSLAAEDFGHAAHLIRLSREAPPDGAAAFLRSHRFAAGLVGRPRACLDAAEDRLLASRDAFVAGVDNIERRRARRRSRRVSVALAVTSALVVQLHVFRSAWDHRVADIAVRVGLDRDLPVPMITFRNVRQPGEVKETP